MTSAAPRRDGEDAGRLPAAAWPVFQAVFLASGFAALLYQMIWQRLLTLFGGADVYSVTLIVSAFMAGLGLGSMAGGHLADRLSLRGRLLAFAASELAIAAFGFASVWILYDALYARLGAVDLPGWATAAILFAVLLWPTFFMGMSLPLLSRALAETTAGASRRIASLYGWNTVGAALGSLLTVWVILRMTDFRRATWIGAAVNAACALAALWLAARTAGTPAERAPGARRHLAAAGRAPPRGLDRALRALRLHRALAGDRLVPPARRDAEVELVHVRDPARALPDRGRRGLARRASRWRRASRTARARVSCSSRARSRSTRRSRWPPSSSPLRGGAGCSRCGNTWPATRASRSTPRSGPRSATCSRWARWRPQAHRLTYLLAMLYVALPVVLVGPPTLMMGLSFAFLQRAVQTDLSGLGRRVGWLQAANIAGSTLGSVVTGVVLLDVLGTAATLRLLIALGGVFLVLAAAWAARPRRLPALAAAAATVAMALAASPGADKLWARLHGARIEDIVFAEDGSGLSSSRKRGR